MHCCFCPATITSTSPSVSTPRSWVWAPRPMPSTSPAMFMPMPACRAITLPAPSGAPLRISLSLRPVALCSGPFRKPRRSAACTSTAISCFIRTTAGPAAAGCPTRWSTAPSTPARSSNGLHATVSGAVGPALTGTWCSSATSILPPANGPRRPTQKSPLSRSYARNPFSMSTRAEITSSVCRRCAAIAPALPGAKTPPPAAPFRSIASSSRIPATPLPQSTCSFPRAAISSSLPASTSSLNRFASPGLAPLSSALGSLPSSPSTARPHSPPPMSMA